MSNLCRECISKKSKITQEHKVKYEMLGENHFIFKREENFIQIT